MSIFIYIFAIIIFTYIFIKLGLKSIQLIKNDSLEKRNKSLCPGERHYKISNYYTTQNSFPFNVLLVNLKYRIGNSLKIYTQCLEYVNKVLNFKVFNLPIITIKDPNNFKRTKRDLVIYTVKYEHLNHEPFDGKGCILAHATLPPGKELCMDASEDWTELKLKCTFLHELGHILGLGHSLDPKSLMYSSLLYVEQYSEADIENIYELYPFMRKSINTVDDD